MATCAVRFSVGRGVQGLVDCSGRKCSRDVQGWFEGDPAKGAKKGYTGNP